MPPGRPLALGKLVMTPARRAAILIGVPIVFLIFIAGGYSFVGSAGTGSFPVSASIPLPKGQLSMHFDGGSGTLQGSSALSATARVNGTVSYHLARPTLRTGAGTLSLTCPIVDEGNCSLDGSVDVPAGTVLTVTTGGGNLTASNLSGGGTLGADGGNVSLSQATGDFTLTSGGGSVRASHVSGQMMTMSADGGNITGSAITATRLTADSGGGDVTLTLNSSPRDLQVTADGGNITIVVPPGKYIVNANADGGTMDSTIPSTPGAQDVISATSSGGNVSITTS
ncbi:MAG TPA: DUF4097 family beta strand repeat-containing protein [Trebonia sp.]|nr:DUF4097 family beta strand repeat-containing protein [Trebonia sp.]